MPINYAPCTVSQSDGAVFWLPLPIVMWRAEPIVEREKMKIPGRGYRTLAVERMGTRISIQGRILGYPRVEGKFDSSAPRTREGALAILKAMQGYTVGGLKVAGPFDGIFDLYRYDSFKYTDCELESFTWTAPRHTSAILEYSLEINSSGAYSDYDAITAESDWSQFIGGN